MPNPLLTALAAVERVVGHGVARVRRQFGLWDDLHVLPYHGYGRPGLVRLKGRVLDDEDIGHEGALTRWESAKLTARRFISDEVSDARVRITLAGTTVEVTTDQGGYYEAELAVDLGTDQLWHEAEVELLEPVEPDRPPARATQGVLTPPEGARFLLISDLDDTVIRTGATNKFRFARVVLLNNATTREVFPGVGAFYQALGEVDGTPTNPVFYLSSSPWNLYRQFVGALDHRQVPPGAVFLKDFGVDRDKFIKTGHYAHKLERIERLFAFYPDLPAVLVGDSGQEDPEIYQQAVARHPGRVRAVFIRDVTADGRDREVDQIVRDVEARGVPMRRVESTEEAVEAAVEIGLVGPEAVERVRRACEEERPD